MKNKNGITLIALIITIIILLILAGVTISVLLGNNGLVKTAKMAGEEYKIQAAKEKLEIKLADITIRIYEKEKRKTNLQDLIIINKEETTMKVETIQENEEGNEIEEVVKIYIEEQDNKQYTKVVVDGYAFKVDEDMNITYIENNENEKNPDKDNNGDNENNNQEPEEMLGNGTPSNPYQIRTVPQLQSVVDELDAHYILMNDLDLSVVQNWEPLGEEKTPFTGAFNGNGYTISNMNINKTTGNLGLFGYTERSTIKNLNLDNYTIQGLGNNIGGLVGRNLGDITKVKTNGTITMTGTSSKVGGVVGRHDDTKNTSIRSSITQCYTEGTITYSGTTARGEYVGGIIRTCNWS